MRLIVGDNQGWVVVDDNTGKILAVQIDGAVEGKFDSRAFSSYSNHKDGTNTAIEITPCSNHAHQQEWDEEESNKRMNIIGQNGNTGEHYD